MNVSIKKSLALFSVTLAVATLTGAAYADVNSARQPSYVYLRNLSYAGSGCPAGSVASNISASRDSVTVFFDSFIAEIGRGVPLSASRKNCHFVVDLGYPSGWSYTVDSVNFDGSVDLDFGVRAEIASAIYFQGSASTARQSWTLYGPTSRDYHISPSLGDSAQVWSPCGTQRALNINFQIRLSGFGGSGLVSMSSPDNGISQPFTLRWKRC